MKRLATIAMLLAIVGSNVFADAKPGGIARQVSMGGSVAGSGLILNPFIMDDPALVLLNPAYQSMYSDYAWMNVAGGALTGLSTGNNGYGHQTAGLAFSLNNEWTIGAILSHDPSAANNVSSLISGGTVVPGFPALPSIVQRTGGGQPIPAIANVWELLTTYDMGSVDLGFGFMYGNSHNDTKSSVPSPSTSVDNEASASMFGFRAGAIIDLGSGNSVDLSGALRLDNATDKMTNTPAVTGAGGEYSASGTEIQVAARAKMKMSNKVNFVPYGMFAVLSAEPKEDSPPTGGTATTVTEDVSAMAYAVGVGGEYRTPTFYLAGGVSLQSAKAELKVNSGGTTPTTTTTTFTHFALPVLNIGGEWWFTDWLAGRGGYYRSLAKNKTETEISSAGVTSTSETSTSFPHSFLLVGGLNPSTFDGLVTLGLGFRFGGFSLDATVSEEALRRGLGLIGAQDNINTFGYITTSYNFE
ncbi:MAG: hypothetical protein ACKVRP_15755 [Bacteroidota bacterium]